MNDLEHDLRTLLQDKAAGAGTPEPSPPVLRRARWRQLGTVLGGIAVAAAVAGGAIFAITELGPADRHAPADSREPVIDTTVNGITISHPESWYVVDPVAAGTEPGSRDLPRLVLFVSDTDPMVSGTLGCPGRLDGATDGFVMTLQEDPLALVGDASGTWPVALAPMDVGTSESACYPNWTFLRASWTVSDRTFEARVGLGPDVSAEGRAALDAAFASLQVAPSEGGPDSVVISAGTTAGEDWQLSVRSGQGGLEVGLQWASGGAGTGTAEDVSGRLSLSSQTFGEGDGAQLVVFGAVPASAVRIEATDGQTSQEVPILDIPDTIDPRWNALVFATAPVQGIVVTAYDAEGGVVASAEVGPGSGGPAVGAPSPIPTEVLFRGRTNECFWTLSRWSEGPDRERLELVPRDGGTPVDLVVDTSSSASPLQLASFDCPTDGTDAVLVFGIATDDAASIRWTDTLEAGAPDCIESTLPSRLCVVLNDVAGPGEAVALDAAGREIARVPY
jgi:hypothetical protein